MRDEIAPYVPTDRDICLLALWSGVVMGLGEALLFLGWHWAGSVMSVSPDIVWAAVLVDTALCVVGACVLVAVVRVLPGLRRHVPLLVAFLVFTDWAGVAFNERIHVWVFPIVGAGLAKITIDLVERERGRLRRVVSRSVVGVVALAAAVSVLVPVGERVIEARAVAALPAPPARAPNVLILLIDTFRADHSSAYGYDRETTPRIDSFARGGVLFERAFSTSSYTLASHASILTGLLPHQHGAEWDDPSKYLTCGCTTLGEALEGKGYVTAGFSANPYWFTREYGFGRGFQRFEDFFNSPADAAVRTAFGRAVQKFVLPRLGYLDIPGRKSAEFENRRLLRWLDGDEGRPFFAFVNYFDIHDPYLPPEPYRSRFAGHPVGGLINQPLTGMDPRLSDDEIHDEMDAYDGAITYIDEHIGALLDSLDARGVLDNTLVVITSDHGEEFGEHGLVLHGHSIHAQSIHVPLVIRGPRVPAGVRVRDPVSNAALPSTLTALAFDEDEFPMGPLLGPSAVKPDPPVSELVKKPWGSRRFPAFHGAMQSVVEGPWHYIRHEVFGTQLYNLESDLAELHDLSDDPAQADRMRHMDGLVEAAWDEPFGEGRSSQ